MTRADPTAVAQMAQKRFVLATDLDGTFLGGSAQERADFYAWLTAYRAEIGLIFVTGRDPAFITRLTRLEGVPRPDYVVGDVGTTIAEMKPDHQIVPLAELEREIAQAWGSASLQVLDALQNWPGLKLQPTAFRHRLSFDMEPARFDTQALEIVSSFGLDALISDNRYFDVLPKGVSKGPSLVRLLDHLGLDRQRTLVAGDTLNDLSMLALGLPAVAVGGSEPKLLAALDGHSHVHRARGRGVVGIAEAIDAFDLFPQSSAVLETETGSSHGL